MGYIHIGPLHLPIPFGKGNKPSQKRLNEFMHPETGIKKHIKIEREPQPVKVIEEEEGIYQMRFYKPRYLKQLMKNKKKKAGNGIEEIEFLKASSVITKKRKQKKQSSVMQSIGKRLEGNFIEKAVVGLLAFIMMAIPIGFIVVVSFISLLLLCPECVVGGVEYVPINSTSLNQSNVSGNLTNKTTIPIQLPPNATIKEPEQPPPPPVNTTEPEVNETQIPVNATTLYDEGGRLHILDDIPESLRWQAYYMCYWDIRDQGVGKYFSVEEECNAQRLGIWIDACECYEYMQNNPHE